MQFQNVWLVVVALFSTGYATNFSAIELDIVQVLFRHGERNPQKVEYNLLNYIDLSAYGHFGLEHLTNIGKMQAFKVGQMLKNRYKKFMNKSSISKDVYARSSEDERTRMTLLLVLAGLFPPTKEQQWHPTLDWMPIPYLYAPAELDSLLKTQHTDKFEKLHDEVWKTTWGLEQLDEFKDLFDLLDKHGVKVQKNLMGDISLMHNILVINERLNLSLPEWYTTQVKPRFQKGFETYHDSLVHTQELKRLNAGPIIKTFINNMNLNQSVENPKKLYLYSGHDLNVGAVIRALKVDGFKYSDFCSTLILEKWRGSENQTYVRLIHWDAINEKLSNTKMGDCEEFCPINDFSELTRDVIPTDEELFSMYKQYDVDYVKKFSI